jgi:hypothetical protein
MLANGDFSALPNITEADYVLVIIALAVYQIESLNYGYHPKHLGTSMVALTCWSG